MLEKLKKWLGIKPNDWKIIWSESAVQEWIDLKVTENWFYYIEYSDSRNTYRLKTSEPRFGYKQPKDHSFYGVALKKLAEYNNETIS